MGGRLESESGEVFFTRDMDDPHRRTVHVDRIGGHQRSDDEGHEVGGHDHGVGEAEALGAVGQRGPCLLGGVREGGEPDGDIEGDGEDGLAIGFVEAGEGAPGIGGFELGGAEGMGGAVGT